MAEPYPLCYLNGSYLPVHEAHISPFDRGFLYGDGCYEVMPVYAGRPFRFTAHAERLTRSLAEIRMIDPHTHGQWREIIARLLAPNGPVDQYVYWQVTRGAENGRNHVPLPNIPRTVFAFCAPFPRVDHAVLENGVPCITTRDTRWTRCDIKSVSLLPNVLLRQLALDAGASEALLLRDGELTEGSSSAVHIVVNGAIRSPPGSHRLLPGTTRGVIEELAERTGIAHHAMRITEADLREADEIWISSAVREVLAVTTLDGRPVGTGKPGPLYRRMREAFERYKAELAGQPW